MGEQASAYAKIPHEACADSRLSDSDFRVLCAITRWDWDGRGCWTGTAQIQRQAGAKQERATQRAITRLQSLGYIKIDDVPDKKSRRIITIVWPGGESADTPVKNDAHGRQKRRREGVKNDGTRASFLTPKETTLKKTQEEVVLSTTTTTAPESSSLSSDHRKDSSDGIPTQEPDLGAMVASVLEVVKPFDFAERTIRAAVSRYSAEWVGMALQAARQKKAQDRVVTWGYVAAVLRNWRKDGEPSPPSGFDASEVRPLNKHEIQSAQRKVQIAERKAARLARGADDGEPDIPDEPLPPAPFNPHEARMARQRAIVERMKAAEEREAELSAAVPQSPHETRMALQQAIAERRKLERLAREEEERSASAMAS